MADHIRRRDTRGSGRPRVEPGGSEIAAGSADPSGAGSITPATRSAGEEIGRHTRLATRAAYRTLIVLGLAPDEASNVIAWMVGIDIVEQHWSLNEVNQLLFVRILSDHGSFAAEADRPSARNPGRPEDAEPAGSSR